MFGGDQVRPAPSPPAGFLSIFFYWFLLGTRCFYVCSICDTFRGWPGIVASGKLAFSGPPITGTLLFFFPDVSTDDPTSFDPFFTSGFLWIEFSRLSPVARIFGSPRTFLASCHLRSQSPSLTLFTRNSNPHVVPPFPPPIPPIPYPPTSYLPLVLPQLWLAPADISALACQWQLVLDLFSFPLDSFLLPPDQVVTRPPVCLTADTSPGGESSSA